MSIACALAFAFFFAFGPYRPGLGEARARR
jgi:hypothetical protein